MPDNSAGLFSGRETVVTLYDTINALHSEAGSYSEGVRLRMRIMGVSFFAGIVVAPGGVRHCGLFSWRLLHFLFVACVWELAALPRWRWLGQLAVRRCAPKCTGRNEYFC